MNYLIFFFILTISLFANDNEALLQEAKAYEEQNNYKAAMEIYKKLALEQNDQLSNELELNNKQRQHLNAVNKTIDKIEDQQTRSTLEQIIASNFDIYPHKENYFFPFSYDMEKRADREQMETKFQLSVKKPIVYNYFGFDETINFGYTHTSWWQLYQNSAPFRETNYQPEIFVQVPYKNGALKGFSVGVLHESNGQGEPESRSWNRLYMESYFQRGKLFVIPKLWYRFPENEKEDDNPDIEDYLGYGELKMFYPYKSHTFKLKLRNNLKLNDNNKGFGEFTWGFPFFNSKNTFGFFQLSSGYGDSLIDYNKEINRISFGISLSR